MPIVRLDPKLANFLIHGDERYFLISFDKELFVAKDNCPHRGGPIHLGNLNKENNAIICPWHKQTVSLQCLQKVAVPIIYRRNKLLTVVLPQSDSRQIVVKHRQILVTV